MARGGGQIHFEHVSHTYQLSPHLAMKKGFPVALSLEGQKQPGSTVYLSRSILEALQGIVSECLIIKILVGLIKVTPEVHIRNQQ